jgi:hypothetical protein
MASATRYRIVGKLGPNLRSRACGDNVTLRRYLLAVKRKQTVREIATALKEGGMESTAANWETTVTGALHRLNAVGGVLRFKDGWGLAEFYPEGLRNRIAKDAEPKKKRCKFSGRR